MLESELEDRIQRHRDVELQAIRSREEFAEAYQAGAIASGASLQELVADPLFHLGLRLSGRALARRAEDLLRHPPQGWGHRDRHTTSKLLAYLGRFTTKTSPHGVFCATGIGELGEGEVSIGCENRFARLDFLIHVGEARKIAACLAISPEAQGSIVPRVNPTLRREGDAWTLWRPATARREDDREVRTQVKDHPVLAHFVEAVGHGADVERILREVGARVGRDVRPFYAQLVERGVLIGEVEIPWSERRILGALAERCPGAPWADELRRIEHEVEALGSFPCAEIESRMDRLDARLELLPHVRPLVPDDLFRCDAATAMQVKLPRALLHDLERFVPLYARFYGAIYPEALFRETFARRFLNRFPADEDVSVLDLYHGLFEPDEPMRPAAFRSPRGKGRSGSPLRERAADAFDRAREFFARRAGEAAGQDEVALTEDDWNHIAGEAPEPRFSCAALFQVAAASTEQAGSARARLCLNAFFPGAGISVARLAHLHPSITSQLQADWARQSRPDAEHAEITFMHGGRTANAGLRPPIFPLEIELPGDRATPGREALPLADLTARWDRAAERFVIRSRSRGTEILPVISSGISPEGIISFLTMAGSQGVQPLGLFPGFDHPDIRRWPRFRFGNVILFRRRWAFASDELPIGGSPAEHFLATQRWRREHGLPAHVFVHSERETKPFYVNLSSVGFVDLLRRATEPANNPGRVHVSEMLPGPDDLWIRDGRGRYAAEFLVHLDNLDPA
ncbi:MAG TPA: lantibiotic dehydratase [Candidatus Polarisedimenticolia bacterium]|nr:lantibiotic dehydratase [Candidatus Polarisedimenticolia bacterium]